MVSCTVSSAQSSSKNIDLQLSQDIGLIESSSTTVKVFPSRLPVRFLPHLGHGGTGCSGPNFTLHLLTSYWSLVPVTLRPPWGFKPVLSLD